MRSHGSLAFRREPRRLIRTSSGRSSAARDVGRFQTPTERSPAGIPSHLTPKQHHRLRGSNPPAPAALGVAGAVSLRDALAEQSSRFRLTAPTTAGATMAELEEQAPSAGRR